MGLDVLNIGTTPTFRRPGHTGTIPDITFASSTLVLMIVGWRVIEDYTASDHQYIAFHLLTWQNQGQDPVRPRRWNVAKLDKAKYARAMERGVAELDSGPAGLADAEELTSDVMGIIEKACQASMPRSVPKHGKKPVYWWTQEIADLRREFSKLRRRLQRAKTQSDRDSRSVDYKAARKC